MLFTVDSTQVNLEQHVKHSFHQKICLNTREEIYWKAHFIDLLNSTIYMKIQVALRINSDHCQQHHHDVQFCSLF